MRVRGLGHRRRALAGVATVGFAMYTSAVMTLAPLVELSAEGDSSASYGTSEQGVSVQMPPSPEALRGLQEQVEEGTDLLETLDGERFRSSLAVDLNDALASAEELRASVFSSADQVRSATRELSTLIQEASNEESRRKELEESIEEIAESSSVGVFAFDTTDDRLLVAVNADKQFTSASTYKLFVAYSMFEAVNDGTWDWNDSLLGTRTLSQCFDDMIIESDNECSEKWLEQVGPDTVHEQILDLGLTSTNVEWSAMRTTASDLAHFLREVVLGDALSAKDLKRLTTAMETQEFREGIPTGLPFAVVWDKVGFLDQYLHDAAVVKSDKGDMILVILTAGGSWETIADVAYAVYDSY